MINNLCQLNTINNNCSQNSYWSGAMCICVSGYTMINFACQINQNECPSNSFNNGLGVCVCQQGYYNSSGVCQISSFCPVNSKLLANGTCLCNQGYFNISNYCLKCQPGQYYDQNNLVCVQYCGINSIYNNLTKSCQCITGYGIKTNNNC